MINSENKIKKNEEVDCITLDKNAFEDVKEMLGELLSNKCKYCGDPITKDSFGLIYSGITSCKNILCLTEAYDEIEEQKRELVVKGNKITKQNYVQVEGKVPEGKLKPWTKEDKEIIERGNVETELNLINKEKMKATNEEYFIGNKICIQVIPEFNEKNEMGLKKPHILILGPEDKIPGAKPESDEEYSSPILDSIEFKDIEDLELFQNGLDVIQRALIDNENFKNEKELCRK